MQKIKNLNLLLTLLFLIPFGTSFGADEPEKSPQEQCTALEDDDPKAAITFAEQQLSVIDSTADPISYGHFIGCMGWGFASTDQIDSARTAAFDLYNHAFELTNSEDVIKLIRRSGAIYHRIGERISAVEIYQEAMNLAGELELVNEQIPLLINLGVLNSEIENHETAIENYYTALDLMKEIDDFRYQPPVLYNLASTLRGQKRHEEALKIYQLTEGLINEHWPKSRIAQIYFGLGVSYDAVNQFENALDYLVKARQLTTDSENETVMNYSIKISEAIVDFKLNPEKEFNQLADQAKAFYLLPENKEALVGLNHPLGSLAHIYELMNRPEDALEVLKVSRQLERDFQKTFNKDYMAQMQNQLNETEKRAQWAIQNSELAKSQLVIKESENQKKLLLLTALFVATLLLFFLYWQSRANKKLKKMAMTDSLTKLGNRRSIQLWHKQNNVPPSPQARYLWLIDLDKFKRVNDEYDHDVGDTALIEIANSLNELSGKFRSLCRWGGEEFMLITDDISPAEKDEFSKLLLETIRNTKIKSGSVKIQLTASIGISQIINNERSNWRRSLYEADKALYTAKDRGRNCAVMATSQM